MKNYSFLIPFLFCAAVEVCEAQTPLISHIYAADPSAHVWPGDSNTLWVYASHDVPGTNHHATMFDYHVFSTTDLQHWTDHGRVLSVDDVPWAVSHAWAIDAVYRHNKYYLVYCMIETATGMFRTGLATSDLPQGPFSDMGFIEGVEWGQDPCLFVDDDDTPYLFWGAGGSCRAVQLTDDLKSAVPNTLVDLTAQLKDVFEGPWVHKYEGRYYLSYPGLPNGKWPEVMYYAVSDKPLGPYETKGQYIPFFEGQAGTNHGSIVQYKGEWLAFHHAALVSGGMSEVRNLMMDKLEYTSQGGIQTIKPAIREKAPVCHILLEAESAPKAGGDLKGTFVENTVPGFSGRGYVTGFDVSHDNVSVLAQVATDMKSRLLIRYRADKDFRSTILVGNYVLNGWQDVIVPKTNGWSELDLGEVSLHAGDNRIRFTCKEEAGLMIDYIKLIPEVSSSH